MFIKGFLVFREKKVEHRNQNMKIFQWEEVRYIRIFKKI